MPDLIGGVGTFGGDPDEPVWVTVATIDAGCTTSDLGVPAFLASVVGDACEGIFVSKQEALQMSQDAYDFIISQPAYIPACTWLQYFAPLAFRDDFAISAPGAEQASGVWRVATEWLQNLRIRTFADYRNNCLENRHRREWNIVYGQKPIEWLVHPALPYCSYPEGVGEIVYSGGTLSAVSFTANFCRPDSTSITWLGSVTQSQTPAQILQGNISMPIPPIPPGYTTPPPPPPLTGSVSSSQISDVDCVDIVIRGGGFRNITDIADEYELESRTVQGDYHIRTVSPNYDTHDELIQTLQIVTATEWAALIFDDDTLTLAEMQAAFDQAPVAHQKSWLRQQVGNLNLLDIWSALALGGNETLVRETSKIILKEVAEAPLILTTVETSNLITESTFTATKAAGGELYLALVLAEEVLKNKIADGTVVVGTCDADISFDIVSLDDSVGIPGAVGYLERNNLAFYQWMADVLQMLLRCCNPCFETSPETAPKEEFWGLHVPLAEANGGEPKRASVNDYTGVDKVVFRVIRNLFPKVYEFGTPDLGLYAKVCWVNQAGEYGKIHFINIDAQELVVDIEKMAGLWVHCYNGVELEVTPFFRATGNPPHNYYDGTVNPRLLP